MILRAYKLKLYPNRGKDSLIDELLHVWKEYVNEYIEQYWDLPSSPLGAFPPDYLMPSGNLRRQAAIKAWQIVKGAKKEGQERPEFRKTEIDLTELNFRLCDFQTKEFDTWFKLSTTLKRKRITIPCKKYRRFNQALEHGKLRKSAKISVDRYSTYLTLYVEFPEKPSENTRRLGVDIGLMNTVVTSDGKFTGQEVQEIRKRTKHRTYHYGPSAQKQAWNKVARNLIEDHTETDFAVEDLFFKGKENRPKSFRRKYNTWAYKTLAKRLEELGETEGFRVFRVNPAYTSQTCPSCSTRSKGNRNGESFLCLSCGYSNHADIVGAKNILSFSDRVPRGLSTRKDTDLILKQVE